MKLGFDIDCTEIGGRVVSSELEYPRMTGPLQTYIYVSNSGHETIGWLLGKMYKKCKTKLDCDRKSDSVVMAGYRRMALYSSSRPNERLDGVENLTAPVVDFFTDADRIRVVLSKEAPELSDTNPANKGELIKKEQSLVEERQKQVWKEKIDQPHLRYLMTDVVFDEGAEGVPVFNMHKSTFVPIEWRDGQLVNAKTGEQFEVPIMSSMSLDDALESFKNKYNREDQYDWPPPSANRKGAHLLTICA